jgi:hypothetical protein
MSRSRWISYGLWVSAGASTVFSILGAMSIGVLILPLAIALLVLAAWKPPRWPEILGLLPGAAAPVLFVGFGRYLRRCTPTWGTPQFSDGAITIRGGSCFSSFDYQSWLLTGLAMIAVGAAAYALARRSSRGGDAIGVTHD